MKDIIDNFSGHSPQYKKFRPVYPPALYESIYERCRKMDASWDCATGNGQVAVELAKRFKRVYATDISANQLAMATKKENIDYSLQRAEQTDFTDDQFDLITVGQAIHWFDGEGFNREVRRVGKNGAWVFIWGYGLLRLHPGLNALIDHLYTDIIGPYWNPERRHIESRYATIEFNFSEIEAPEEMYIQSRWTYDQFIGYLNTWSSVKRYQKQHPGEDPVGSIAGEIKKQWGEQENQSVHFPLFMRIGRVEK